MKITPIELNSLGRFRDCCEDSDAGGHDVPKEMMQRLAAVGAVRTLGFGRHETTEFGDWLLAQPPEAKVSTLAVPDGWKLVPVQPTPEIIAGAAIASWPTATLADIELARQAAPIVLMRMDMAPGTTVDAKDAERLEFIENGTFDLRCYNDHDDDVYWNVIEHHMAAPIEREIGWGNTARQAIDAAIAAKAAS